MSSRSCSRLTVDEEEVERLNRQRASLAEQRSQLEAEIQRLSASAKLSRPEQEKLQKLEVWYLWFGEVSFCR
jgi:hypothetical protein